MLVLVPCDNVMMSKSGYTFDANIKRNKYFSEFSNERNTSFGIEFESIRITGNVVLKLRT